MATDSQKPPFGKPDRPQIRARRAFCVLRLANRCVMVRASVQPFVEAVCDGVVTQGDYLGAFIGQAKRDSASTITVLTAAGPASGF